MVGRSGGREVGRSGGREVRRSGGPEVRRSGGPLHWLAISDQEGIDVWAAWARSDARSARST